MGGLCGIGGLLPPCNNATELIGTISMLMLMILGVILLCYVAFRLFYLIFFAKFVHPDYGYDFIQRNKQAVTDAVIAELREDIMATVELKRLLDQSQKDDHQT